MKKLKIQKPAQLNFKSKLSQMDESQFDASFVKLIRAAVEANQAEALALVFRRTVEGSAVGADQKGVDSFKMARKVMEKVPVPCTQTDQELAVSLYDIAIQSNILPVAQCLLVKLDAPLHHAIRGDCKRYELDTFS